MNPSIFALCMPPPIWGDYGSILTHGMTASDGRDAEGRLRLERTGPFVPPLSFPVMAVIVTGDTRAKLEASGLTGMVFTAVALARIVKLDWRSWDLTAPDPKRYPLGGEPENYILRGKHRPELAAEMGPMFEFSGRDKVPLAQCGTERRFADNNWPILRPSRGAWKGEDVFGLERGSGVLVTERGQAWLEKELGDWVRFEEEQWAD